MYKPVFSYETIRQADNMMINKIKPAHDYTAHLTDEDIERAWRQAANKFFGRKEAAHD